MKHVKLRMVSEGGVATAISTDGNQGGAEEYHAVVSADGFMRDRKVFDIDLLQSFVPGFKLVEDLTPDKRLGEDDEAAITPGSSWRIEVVED
jgi:hypothetical protein